MSHMSTNRPFIPQRMGMLKFKTPEMGMSFGEINNVRYDNNNRNANILLTAKMIL
jgi:hypothetical protein